MIMRKLLAFFSVFLLLNSSFGQDVGATFLQTPSTFATICPDPAQSISVVIENKEATVFNFVTSNVRVTVNVTGPIVQSFTEDVTTGTIAGNQNYLVNFASTCDLSLPGTYVFTYSTSVIAGVADVNPANDGGGPVNVVVE